jgi:phosphatidylserine decarboxylase
MKNTFKKISLGVAVLLGIVIIIFIQFFNRAPERIVPEGNVIVSPANGDVIHIERVQGNEISFFKKDTENVLTINDIQPPYTIIVIEMDPSDVHVQRMPIAGEIIHQEHFDGAHKNALSSENVEQLANVNEKNLIIIENQDLSVGVIQVAGMAARRIRSFVEVGDTLEKGDTYGRIILGSQVVIILPDEVEVIAEIGDVLVDGETIVGAY